MKVLFVYDCITKYGGGSQQIVLSWVKNLRSMGVEVKILVGQGVEKVDLTIPREILIVNKSLNLDRLYPGLYLSTLLSTNAKKAIQEFDPDIIHINEASYLNFWVINYAKKAGKKIVGTFHTNVKKTKIQSNSKYKLFEETGLIGSILEHAMMNALKKCDVVTVPSMSFLGYVSRKTHTKTEVLKYPVAKEFFSKTGTYVRPLNPVAKATSFITLSRLVPEKNIDILIKAFVNVDDGATLTIIGDGFEKAALQKLATKLGISHKINFMGWIPNKEIPAVFKQYDMFISASDFETYGLTTLEALACRLPCILFDYDVAREVLPKGTGILVTSKNPKAWAEAIKRVYKSSVMYNKFKETINKKYFEISKNNEIVSAESLLALYKRTLAVKSTNK